MKKKRRRKSSTEYAAEQREAQRYANLVPAAAELQQFVRQQIVAARDIPSLQRGLWVRCWEIAYTSYLAGLRRKHRKDPSKK